MKIKTLQWNIGGGKIRDIDSISTIPESYKIDSLEYIIDFIELHNPDVITLEETHQNGRYNQAEIISYEIGYDYFVNDVYDESHLEAGQGLGQAIISRFPIKSHQFDFFFNPEFQESDLAGNFLTSHDKGITKCDIQVTSNEMIEVGATHFIPFRFFNVDLLDVRNKDLVDSISGLISTNKERYILQGDLNIDSKSIKNYLPKVFNFGMKEVELNSVTTPKNRYYDHVLYKGVKVLKQEIFLDVLTDHYPIVTEFEL